MFRTCLYLALACVCGVVLWLPMGAMNTTQTATFAKAELSILAGTNEGLEVPFTTDEVLCAVPIFSATFDAMAEMGSELNLATTMPTTTAHAISAVEVAPNIGEISGYTLSSTFGSIDTTLAATTITFLGAKGLAETIAVAMETRALTCLATIGGTDYPIITYGCNLSEVRPFVPGLATSAVGNWNQVENPGPIMHASIYGTGGLLVNFPNPFYDLATAA